VVASVDLLAFIIIVVIIIIITSTIITKIFSVA